MTSAKEPTSRPWRLMGATVAGGLSWVGPEVPSPVTDWTDKESGLCDIELLVVLDILVRLKGREWNLFSGDKLFVGAGCSGGEAFPNPEEESLRDFAESSATVEFGGVQSKRHREKEQQLLLRRLN